MRAVLTLQLVAVQIWGAEEPGSELRGNAYSERLAGWHRAGKGDVQAPNRAAACRGRPLSSRT